MEGFYIGKHNIPFLGPNARLSSKRFWRVGHDVHHPNNRHCQCHSCNHPCAHICKTRKPKGKRWTEDMAHMCHFSSKPHATMCCGGEDLPAAMQPLKEPGTSWKHSEVISSFQTVPAEILHQRKATLQSFSFNPTRSASIAKDFSLKKHQIDDRFNRDSIKDSSNENGSNNNINRDNNKNEKSSCNNLHDAEIVPQQRSTTPRPPSSLETSCFLERTGSDLSISSLPSSSSVAEIYINRSVLTDESDIDSETERSLDSNRQQRQNTKQGFRSLVACFLANSLRLKSIKFDSQNQSDLSTNRSRKLHHPTTKINHHRHHSNASARKKVIRTKRKPQRLGLSSTDTSYHLDVAPQNNPSTSKNLKKNNIENENRSHSGSSATPQPCFTSATDQFIQSIKMNPAHNHTSNQVYSSPRIDQMQKYQSMKMNLSNQKLSPYACTPLNSNLDHNRSQPNFATNMPPLPPIPVSSQQSLLSHRSHPIDGHISEEPLTSTSSSTTQKYTIAESSDINNSTSHNEKSISSQTKQALNYSTTTSGENSQSPRRRRQKGPAPKPPSKDRDDPVDYSSRRMTNVQPISTTSPTASSFNQSLSNSSLTTNCSVNVDKKIFQNLVLDDGGVRGFGDGLDGADDDDNEGGGNNDGDNPQSLQQQSPNQLPPNLVRSLSEQKQLNMKLMINAVPTFRSEVNLQKISDAKIVTKTDTIAGGDDVDVDDLKVNNNEKKSRNAMHNNLDADDDDVILINNLNYGDIGKNIKKSKHNNGDQPKHHHHRNHQHHHHHHHHRRHHHHHNQDNQKNDTILLKHKDEKIDENIYEIPISGRNLLKIKQNDDDYPPPPLLPKKTFDPLKVFGCSIDTDTNKLLERKEQESNDQNRVCQRTKRELSLSKMAPSDLIPLEQYTCCALHWQEYLDQISSTIVEPIMVVGDVGPTIVCDDNLEDDSQHEISKNIAAKSEYSKIQNEKIDGVGDCYQCKTCGTMMDKKIMNNEPNESDALMIDALLSPKHDHVRWKRNSLIQLVNNDENKGGGSLTKSISPSTDDFNHIDSLFEEMINCELVRTCSDGSLTNTASLATVVEQQSDTLPNHSNLIRFQDLCRNSNLKGSNEYIENQNFLVKNKFSGTLDHFSYKLCFLSNELQRFIIIIDDDRNREITTPIKTLSMSCQFSVPKFRPQRS
ncbi:hypothetical protein QR98_0064290 [Sarcoptes scabiei]|uniref:Uncharacterized protein n=1 Tax=Sarcoptes scabiei TaxID=52283 RepID=A0A132AAJ5_SARSC|nr:hypothetical protein QR98_0064290 [Sarcoptes scabiei]